MDWRDEIERIAIAGAIILAALAMCQAIVALSSFLGETQ